MPESFFTKVSKWNESMNDVPRMLMLVAVTLLCAWITILILPYCWPFAVALIFSTLLEPLVKAVSSRFKRRKLGRNLATLLGMLILFGIVSILLFWMANQVIREIIGLARAVPSFIVWVRETAFPYFQELYAQYRDIWPEYIFTIIDKALSSFSDSLASLATSLSATLASGAISTATTIPGVLLSVVLTIMGTYYMTADRERIYGFFRNLFPDSVRSGGLLIKKNLLSALFGQIKSQLMVSCIIITFLVLSFVIYGIDYGLLIGLLIGVMDALPVVGAGLFLIPWSIFSFIFGNVGMGVFVALIYVGTIVIRQISEPRIVGRNLGLYPLATMVAMYAGYRMMDFVGLLAGPILLNIIRAVLNADKYSRSLSQGGGDEQPAKPAPKKPFRIRAK